MKFPFACPNSKNLTKVQQKPILFHLYKILDFHDDYSMKSDTYELVFQICLFHTTKSPYLEWMPTQPGTVTPAQ